MKSWGLKMLLAKLFTVLAFLLLGFALLEGRATRTPIDVYFHATYLVISPFHFQVLEALTSFGFGLIYLAAARWVQHPLNRTLGIVHLGLVTIGILLVSIAMSAIGGATVNLGKTFGIFIATATMSGEPAPRVWPLFAGSVSFISGCAVLAVNIVWTIIQTFRPE